MVIFGAGASYDSHPDYSSTDPNDSFEASRIPLAGHLFWQGFGEFAREFPACQGLLHRLRRAAPSIEPELESIRDEARRKTFMLRELEAIRYYLQALIRASEGAWLASLRDHVTTYTRLLQEIEDWREQRGDQVALVSFNYDRLLDLACRSVVPEMPLRQVMAYVGGTSHWLFKLHGSVDWHEELTLASGDWPDLHLQGVHYANAIIDMTGRVRPRGRYLMEGEAGEGSWGPLRPAVAIPMVTKNGDDFVCPPEHLDKLRQIVPSVSDLIVIGWRAEEQHFHALWRNSAQQKTQLRRLLVVDSTKESAERIAARIRDAMALSPGITAQAEGNGFTSATSGGVFSRFLAS